MSNSLQGSRGGTNGERGFADEGDLRARGDAEEAAAKRRTASRGGHTNITITSWVARHSIPPRLDCRRSPRTKRTSEEGKEGIGFIISPLNLVHTNCDFQAQTLFAIKPHVLFSKYFQELEVVQQEKAHLEEELKVLRTSSKELSDLKASSNLIISKFLHNEGKL